ncbi:hypothetical protein D3C71_1448450 [compost metagenome]
MSRSSTYYRTRSNSYRTPSIAQKMLLNRVKRGTLRIYLKERSLSFFCIPKNPLKLQLFRCNVSSTRHLLGRILILIKKSVPHSFIAANAAIH